MRMDERAMTGGLRRVFGQGDGAWYLSPRDESGLKSGTGYIANLRGRPRRVRENSVMSDTMSEAKTYSGSCHCGKVRYEVELDLSGTFVACNCSMCGRSGTLLTFVPLDKFKLLSGEDVLTDYQFNKMQIHHFICATCGIKSFAKGTGPGGSNVCAINARCLEGVDPSALKIHQYDGKSL